MFTAAANWVAVAALPLVFTVPAMSTPGNWIAADPSNDCPPMFTAAANWVAVAAFPVVSWLPTASTPGKVISSDPSNETPPISLAVVNTAADPDVAADPDHVVDVNVPVVPPVVPTITSWTLISPEASLATNLPPVFASVASAAIVVSDAPVWPPVGGLPLAVAPVKYDPVKSCFSVGEPTFATLSHVGKLVPPVDFKKWPDEPGVSLCKVGIPVLFGSLATSIWPTV